MKTIKFKLLGKTYFFGNIDEKKINKKEELTTTFKKRSCGYAGYCKKESGNNSMGYCDHHYDLTVWGF